MDAPQHKSIQLSAVQLLTLRSIARESWEIRSGAFEWCCNGQWVWLSRNVDGSWYNKALCAAWEFESQGFVEMATVRCCPGTSCRANDRQMFRLTTTGKDLLQATSATIRPAPPGVQQDRELENHSVGTKAARFGWWRRATSLVLSRVYF